MEQQDKIGARRNATLASKDATRGYSGWSFPWTS